MPITYYKDGSPHISFAGCVLAEGEMNYHDDSDFYAVVWDGEHVRRTEYATTRYGGGGSCQVDATKETIEAASTWMRQQLLQTWKEHNSRQAALPSTGKTVRITKGRPSQKLPNGSRQKIPLGTEGTVVFREERRSQYGTWSYGYRLGIAISNRKTPGYSLTENENTLSLTSPFKEGFPYRARSLEGTWDRDTKTWLFPASRKDEVIALCEKSFPGHYFDIVFTNENNVEVVNPEQYQEPEETGQKWAAARDKDWRAFTYKGGPGLLFL